MPSLELCEEALLRDVPWRGMLRTEETDEEVDLRPRRPVELRRYEDRGVMGEGERDLRWVPLRLVSIREVVVAIVGSGFEFDIAGVSVEPVEDLLRLTWVTFLLLLFAGFAVFERVAFEVLCE